MKKTLFWMNLLLLTAESLSTPGVAKEDIPGGEHQPFGHPLEDTPLEAGNTSLKDENVTWAKITEDIPKSGGGYSITAIHLNSSNGTEHCEHPSIYDFPPDGLTDWDRKNGWLVLHFLVMIYACYALAVLCDSYFVPSLEIICQKLNLSTDVAGATFMAAGTSAPELFGSFIGTFITEGDIGTGTIIGSAVFNILAVTAGCGLLAGMVVPLDWYPLTRDVICYTICVVCLTVFVHDEKIFWYESAILVGLFCLYVLLMIKNRSIEKVARALLRKATSWKEQLSRKAATRKVSETSVNADGGGIGNPIAVSMEAISSGADTELAVVNADDTTNRMAAEVAGDDDDEAWRPCTFGSNSCLGRIIYVICWPANFLFFITIPSPKHDFWKRFYPLTFLLCVIYIGGLSYVIVWMVTIVGYTFGIPDTVMGITFLALSSSTPEGFSSVIVSRKGYGNMAISNSIGSNVFDVLVCLSVPWLVKSLFKPMTTLDGSDGHYIEIKSGGLAYTVTTLLVFTLVMYVSIAVFRFRMNKRVGAICLVLYLLFISFASLVEMNVFGEVNPASCTS